MKSLNALRRLFRRDRIRFTHESPNPPTLDPNYVHSVTVRFYPAQPKETQRPT